MIRDVVYIAVTVSLALACFAAIDFADAVPDVLSDFIHRWLRCEIPENFDGAKQYSPFCVLLRSEQAFPIFREAPTDVMAQTWRYVRS